jgi:AraC family transcriptional regulator, regulatory protein of adaptative response / methylated-DNA-[protein]-cysteine methyltransferase
MKKVIHEICRYIQQHVDQSLSLTAIAKKSGYSATYLQKRFTEETGSSPKVYQTSLRQQRLKSSLKRKEKLTDAIYQAGYGSTSRVYEKVSTKLGMTPKQYRDGGKGLEVSYAVLDTVLGRMILGATERGLCFLQFEEGKTHASKMLAEEFPNAKIQEMPAKSFPMLKLWTTALNEYLKGKSRLENLPLDLRGTAFQMLVWRYLQKIPSGETRSYSQVAKAIGNPKAFRAAASACARNKVAIAIPCHRVIHGNGNVSGYRWGLARKRELLKIEGNLFA